MTETAFAPTLLETIRQDVYEAASPRQQAALVHIDGYDFSEMMRVKFDDMLGHKATAEERATGELWLRQFYAASVLLQSDFAIPGKLADAAWHVHVLYSVPYAEFCEEAFGYYLHHFPHDRTDAVATAALAELIIATAGVFQEIFSSHTPFHGLDLSDPAQILAAVEHCCTCRSAPAANSNLELAAAS